VDPVLPLNNIAVRKQYCELKWESMALRQESEKIFGRILQFMGGCQQVERNLVGNGQEKCRGVITERQLFTDWKPSVYA
jgi:hypothetical protein